jgi:electron transfer flavoprotein alpha subunit
MEKDIFVLIEHLKGQVADLSYLMLAAARQITRQAGGSVVAVLLGNQARHLAQELDADRLLYFEHPLLADHNPVAYRRIMVDLLRTQPPRLALFGDTSIGSELAGMLSPQLNLPLVSNCLALSAENGRLNYLSQICGGKILVEGEIPTPSALVTMIPGRYRAEDGHGKGPNEIVKLDPPSLGGLPISLLGYIEPEVSDVDISRENVLIAIGRGIQNQDNIDMVQELAESLGGVVCASRPVVDQGWLPITRLVGKSGQRVKPTVYLALGISGAPEHAEGITDSQMIIAVNTDPAAPIFSIAQYGLQVDLLDFVPALTERVRAEKV